MDLNTFTKKQYNITREIKSVLKKIILLFVNKYWTEYVYTECMGGVILNGVDKRLPSTRALFSKGENH